MWRVNLCLSPPNNPSPHVTSLIAIGTKQYEMTGGDLMKMKNQQRVPCKKALEAANLCELTQKEKLIRVPLHFNEVSPGLGPNNINQLAIVKEP